MRTVQQVATAVLQHKDGRVQAIFHETSSDERWLDLFVAYLEVHNTWKTHREKLSVDASSFWVDSSVGLSDRLWKHERFGNYLYGCFISTYFCYTDLPNMSPHPNDRFIKPTVLSRFTHNLFATLDSFACLDALVCDSAAHYRQLKSVYYGGVSSFYSEVRQYSDDPDYRYIKDLRNLLTHRPFWQFMIDSDGNYYLPLDPNALDSVTKKKMAYMTKTLAEFGKELFDKTIKMLTASIHRLNAQYCLKI